MTTSNKRLPIGVALLGSGLGGSLVALQSRINGGLSRELGDGYVTAAVSFGSGLVIVCVAMLLSRRHRDGLRLVRQELASGRLPRWALIGGAFGAVFVVSQGLVATVLGVALFTVGVVAGQVLGGLLIDRIGLGPGGRVTPTAQRVFGTLLAVVAVVLSVVSDLLSPGGLAAQLWLVLVPVAAGFGTAFQSAVNGLLRAAAHSAVAATLISFTVGTVLLLIAAAVSIVFNGFPQHWPSELWQYSGGAMGVIFILLAALLVRTAGVLLLSMSNVAGQLIGAVVLEASLPLAGGVSAGMLVGAIVALIAVTIAALPRLRK